MPREKSMAQMKEQIKATKIELHNEEIANLSDAEFKTLAVRMLTEMAEYGRKIGGKSEGYAKWNKNIQGTNSKWKETGIQSNNLEQKEEINIQSEQNEETRIQKKWEASEPLRQL